MLNMFLIEQYSNGKKVVLIVDEAQNLTKKVLEEIRMISGIETHKEKVLRIILAGQPELKDTLESPSLKQLVQRRAPALSTSGHWTAAKCANTSSAASLSEAARKPLFTDDSFDSIYRFTGGVPRLINTLVRHSLALLFRRRKEMLSDGDDVISAAQKKLNWQGTREQ